jgi:Pentapeptide repeats (8 copies)
VVVVGLKSLIWRARHAWSLSGLRKLDYRLRRLPFFLLLEQIAVLVAVIWWISEAGDRTKERHYRAWELINSARGSIADGGRRDALQDLNRDGVSLAKAPLRQAHLVDIDLRGADLQGADLRGADLQGADLSDANLQGAFLGQGANLQGAFLADANLQDASFWGGADLHAALELSNIKNADLQGAMGLTQEILNGAVGDDRTQLPEGLTRPARWSDPEVLCPSPGEPTEFIIPRPTPQPDACPGFWRRLRGK